MLAGNFNNIVFPYEEEKKKVILGELLPATLMIDLGLWVLNIFGEFLSSEEGENFLIVGLNF
jgi:hypothetical protein